MKKKRRCQWNSGFVPDKTTATLSLATEASEKRLGKSKILALASCFASVALLARDYRVSGSSYVSLEQVSHLLLRRQATVGRVSGRSGISVEKKTIPPEGFVYSNTQDTNIQRNYIPMEYSLETYHRSNQDTCMVHKPAVSEGDWVQSGDLLADCSASVGGELSLGQNILVAYMPWEGYNYEDAILISERLVYDDIYTSIHIEKYVIETTDTKYGLEQITGNIPDVSQKDVLHLEKNGIAKLGTFVKEGDILVGKITPINKKSQSPFQKLLYTILQKEFIPFRDTSLRAPKGIKAKVMGIQIFKDDNRRSIRKELRYKPELFISRKKQTSLLNTAKELKNPRPKTKSRIRSRDLRDPTASLSPFYTQFNNLKKVVGYSFTNLLKFNSLALGRRFSPSPLPRKQRGSFQTSSGKSLPESLAMVPSFGAKVFAQSFKGEKTGSSSSSLATTSGTEVRLLAKHAKQVKIHARNATQASKGTQDYRYANDSLVAVSIQKVHIYLAEKRKIGVGDKMAGRHGNKGIVSQILPRQDMPYLPDGTPIDMVLNPLGVPSRMNVGQIYECLLGLAGKQLGFHFRVPPFDEIYGPEASRSFVYSKLYEARKKTGNEWLFDPNYPGKITLFDGRTGDCFDQAITVGQSYMLKLVHLVDDKIHARSTGPYSLVTQQPLRGRSKQGGQRLGEMEVWALEGYGAAFTLLEMLTIKSDNISGRLTLWSNMILNKNIVIGTPESFKVLVSELQALCLNIGLFRTNIQPAQPILKREDYRFALNNGLKEISHISKLP